jgi:LTXXQ motif family protein
MLKAPMLLAAVLVVCVASSADARRRHHGYYGGYGERTSTRFTLDEWRRNREAQDKQQDSQQDRAQTPGQDQARDQDRDQARSQVQDRARDRDDRRRTRYDDWRRSRYDERRARFDDFRSRNRHDWTRAGTAERGDAALRRARTGPFGAVVEKLIRGCGQQGAEFNAWPFDAIAQTVGADEGQRNALAALRGSAKQAAERLTADCPQDVPAAPSARLEAVEQGIDAALNAFDAVQPTLQTFYGALDDEQKARLYRDMAAPAATNAPQMSGRRDRQEHSSRRNRWRAYASADRAAAAPGWSAVCEQLAAVLRGWPVREIERDVRLSGPQRVAFYELVTSSLKAAETLGSACPADTALTPVGRMETMRKRLAAMRAATSAIRPALARFYEALDQGQKVRFAGIS